VEKEESMEIDGRDKPRKLTRKRCVAHMIVKTFGFYLLIDWEGWNVSLFKGMYAARLPTLI
jgi:hypothetical protein